MNEAAKKYEILIDGLLMYRAQLDKIGEYVEKVAQLNLYSKRHRNKKHKNKLKQKSSNMNRHSSFVQGILKKNSDTKQVRSKNKVTILEDKEKSEIEMKNELKRLKERNENAYKVLHKPIPQIVYLEKANSEIDGEIVVAEKIKKSRTPRALLKSDAKTINIERQNALRKQKLQKRQMNHEEIDPELDEIAVNILGKDDEIKTLEQEVQDMASNYEKQRKEIENSYQSKVNKINSLRKELKRVNSMENTIKLRTESHEDLKQNYYDLEVDRSISLSQSQLNESNLSDHGEDFSSLDSRRAAVTAQEASLERHRWSVTRLTNDIAALEGLVGELESRAPGLRDEISELADRVEELRAANDATGMELDGLLASISGEGSAISGIESADQSDFDSDPSTRSALSIITDSSQP